MPFTPDLDIALLIEVKKRTELPNNVVRQLLPELLRVGAGEMEKRLVELTRSGHLATAPISTAAGVMQGPHRLTDAGRHKLEDYFSIMEVPNIGSFVLREICLAHGGSLCFETHILNNIGAKLPLRKKTEVIDLLLKEGMVEEDFECMCGGDRCFEVTHEGVDVQKDQGFAIYLTQKTIRERETKKESFLDKTDKVIKRPTLQAFGTIALALFSAFAGYMINEYNGKDNPSEEATPSSIVPESKGEGKAISNSDTLALPPQKDTSKVK